MAERDRSTEASRATVVGVRYLMPAAIVVTGIALATLGTSDAALGAGVVLIGVGFLVALLNVLMRLGIQSNRDREREERARRYFGRHGRWPGRRLEP
jgi:hypothetical protein